MTTYFKRFFDEKNIAPDETFEFDLASTWHLMSYGVVIDAVKQTTGQEAATIAATLRKIDFANGDVKHYLRHLGRGLAAQATPTLGEAT